MSIACVFDLIIYEQFFFLEKHIAERYNKPVIRVLTSPASNQKLMREFIHSGKTLSIFWLKRVCRKCTKEVAGDFPLKTACWLEEIESSGYVCPM